MSKSDKLICIHTQVRPRIQNTRTHVHTVGIWRVPAAAVPFCIVVYRVCVCVFVRVCVCVFVCLKMMFGVCSTG